MNLVEGLILPQLLMNLCLLPHAGHSRCIGAALILIALTLRGSLVLTELIISCCALHYIAASTLCWC